MKKLIIASLFPAISLFAYGQTDEESIRQVMSDQQECWNQGDLECFMQGYWQSDQLVFIGNRGLTYGWEKTLENYKKGYPDRLAMGNLEFKIKILEPLSEDYWFMVGAWQLKRQDDSLAGHFSLIWRKIDGEWVIVADHSS